MGLRDGLGLVGKALVADCMLCHAGSILGKSYVGLGNSTLDIQALFEDMGKAGGGSGKTPIPFSHVRGTSEAGNFALFLLSYRHPDLKMRVPPLDLGMKDHLCEDVPAWWLLRKKQTMYHTGSTPARSVRSLMQFMLTPPNSLESFQKAEPDFADIQAYLMSLTPPKYPFAIDRELAARGEKLFTRDCAKCHGTYGEKWTYPSKIVPIEKIGTDRTRHEGIAAAWGDYYNKSWFAQEKRPDGQVGYKTQVSPGYQAPPLDGVWATAPYFHNGSVPTIHGVLNSKTRPKVYTRSFRTGKEDYDAVDLGWKVRLVAPDAGAKLPPLERRKIYDTTQPGRGNGGHTFGDHLTDAERRAVLEYLKTL
jgi:mono/diheme cytochrome c family protein